MNISETNSFEFIIIIISEYLVTSNLNITKIFGI